MSQKICRSVIGLMFSALVAGCSPSFNETVATQPETNPGEIETSDVLLDAFWLREANGEILRDPQTSGLVAWRNNTLMSVSDGSAHASQVLNLLVIDPAQFRVVQKIPMSMSETLAQSCFAEFLSERPDLEALVVDPDDDSVFYTITEDASDHQLTEQCQQRFGNTGSTAYPNLLLRIKLTEDGKSAQMTHARALQYSPEMQVGNFPNDGIEGMTFGRDRQLYLGLEKDANYHARVFSIEVTDEFWITQDFAPVTDLKLDVPVFDDQRPHPINALAFASFAGTDWLLAAARNDNQLWAIDANGERETQIIPLSFAAQVTDAESSDCPSFEPMNNYSMEGIAVAGDTLWIVNDPWKHNYMKNLQCPSNKDNYEKMAPLLTSIKLDRLF